MSKKDNFSQAMFEMFGLGKAPEEGEGALDEQLENFEPAAAADEPASVPAPEPAFDPSVFDETPAVPDAPTSEPVVPAAEVSPAEPPAPRKAAPAAEQPNAFSESFTRSAPVKRANCTYFAEGTSMEGTLRSDSDVEICGDFKGEIAADGKVTIHANTTSSVAAAELILLDCKLIGDAMVSGDISINDGSSVAGNLRAENVICSGNIKGNLNVSGNITLTENAQVLGDIKTGTLTMSRGAKVSGKIDMGG